MKTNVLSCAQCWLAKFCFPPHLSAEEQQNFETIAQHKQFLKPKEILFKEQESCRSLFVVRSGSLKTIRVVSTGAFQITGFHFPSDVLGLESIHLKTHADKAIALETSSICEIRLSELVKLLSSVPALLKQFMNLMSEKILLNSSVLFGFPAEQRLAFLLLNFSNKMKRIGMSGTELNLHMSREDIGNHLGLAAETISRIFTKFKQMGLIEIGLKNITILDFNKLQKTLKYNIY